MGDPAWEKIQSLTEEHLQEQVSLDQEEKRLMDLIECLKSQLQHVQEKKIQAGKAMQQQMGVRMIPSSAHLDELNAIAQRVGIVETDLVSALETELEQKKPQLSALADLHSTQPKLSLYLNCMGISPQGVHITRQMDSTQFKRQTKISLQFMEEHRTEQVPPNVLKDLLSCGEIL